MSWMIALIVVGLLGILVAAVVWPNMFRRYVETIVSQVWIAGGGAIWGLWEYFQTDPTWQQLIKQEYLPWAVVAMGVLGVLIRLVNRDRSR